MWALRVLNGSQAGKVIPLESGKIRIGRTPQCQICLNDAGVSKAHAEITVLPDRLLLADLNSSNGTFLNGVRSQGSVMRLGDKIGFGSVLCDVVVMEKSATGGFPHASSSSQGHGPHRGLAVTPAGGARPHDAYPLASQGYGGGPGMVGHPSSGNLGPQYGSHNNSSQGGSFGGGVVGGGSSRAAGGFHLGGALEKLQGYLNQVFLPGVYKLGETFEYKMVVLGLLMGFVFLVTLLSILPMKQITSESISAESRRRAITIARALAQSNEKVLRSGDLSSFSTDLVLREDGIEDVYVVSREGNILAPPERVGSTPKEISFLRQLRGQTKETAQNVRGKIAAAVPILAYDPEIQQNIARAYAIVVYNPGGLEFDDGRALGLFIQMLALALLLGFAVFYLLLKFTEYPLKELTQALNQALTDNQSHIELQQKHPILQDLLTTLNSLLVRALSAPAADGSALNMAFSRDHEMGNLVEMLGYPALVLNNQKRIIKVNSPFESMLSLSPQQLDGQPLSQLPDQAMQKNFESLMETASQQPDVKSQDKLELSGHPFILQCVALRSSQGEVEYFIINISPEAQNQGSAA